MSKTTFAEKFLLKSYAYPKYALEISKAAFCLLSYILYLKSVKMVAIGFPPALKSLLASFVPAMAVPTIVILNNVINTFFIFFFINSKLDSLKTRCKDMVIRLKNSCFDITLQ